MHSSLESTPFLPIGTFMSSTQESTPLSFSDMGLTGPVLQAVGDAGYEKPTAIQEEMIPHMMANRDVVGQAQTGTGKTAAFALPLLTRIQPGRSKNPQILVLAPTRELAIQVAKSFETYGKHIKNLTVLPIFGGQDYSIQLKQLHKGVHVVVGTPGRVMDHIRKGTLKLTDIHSFILDEADEMLKMGFIDDVEWVLEQLPASRQTALFSATMPRSIREIARKHLSDPVEITIKTKTATAITINQRYVLTAGLSQKFETVSRILEIEDFDGVLIFVRTKIQTLELAEKLSQLGHKAAPLNGDIQQSQRLRTIDQLKSKKIDILVATDVAARGLDVERISHVINYDIPFDQEAYIHRIGRTGRAGRSGEAILFVNPRERSMLKSIERVTRQKIEIMKLPTSADINTKRIEKFKAKITSSLQGDTGFYQKLIREYLDENTISAEEVAAALAHLIQGGKPMLLPEDKFRKEPVATKRRDQKHVRTRKERRPSALQLPPEEGMERFRIEVGRDQGIKPSNIVGAIANEADISSKHIGRISIYDSHSTVDLPYGMPQDVLRILHRVRVGSRSMKLSRIDIQAAPTAQNDTKENTPTKRTRRKGQRKNIRKSAAA
jgi:ATP-dependent RNA helicase DeaD